MIGPARANAVNPLLHELRWFVQLRWIAGGSVLVGMTINAAWTGGASADHLRFGAVGAFILIYNLLLHRVLARVSSGAASRGTPHRIALAQIILDLACLALLSLWSGGFRSPLIGLFVLHMVFASLMLPNRLAYSAAGLAISLMAIGTWLTGQWPATGPEVSVGIGWLLILLLLVYLTNHITRTLRERDEQLRRQQRGLVQSEKTTVLGQMAAGVAHELTNPLASMDSLLQLMLRRPDRMNRESVDVLRGQIERMHKTIHLMRTFAHPGAIDPQPASVAETVERALDLAAFDRRLRKVELVRSICAKCGNIPLVPQMIEQVVVNLLMNAVDAVEDRPAPKIEVDIRRIDDDCIISVTDNGEGIAPEHLGRIFDPFFTTKPVGRGTGLGLAISSRMVEEHRGRLEVESDPGRATTFRVILPRATPE